MAKQQWLVVDEETGQWRFSTLAEDIEFHRKVNYELFGKYTDAGVYYQNAMNYYKKKLEEEESWLRTNPYNKITQRKVAQLRKLYEENKEMNEHFK